jgi:hypothetical protein
MTAARRIMVFRQGTCNHHIDAWWRIAMQRKVNLALVILLDYRFPTQLLELAVISRTWWK